MRASAEKTRARSSSRSSQPCWGASPMRSKGTTRPSRRRSRGAAVLGRAPETRRRDALQLDRLLVALQVFPLVAGTKDVHVAAAPEPAVLLGVPAELPAAAVQAVRPAVRLRLLVVDLDVPLQA